VIAEAVRLELGRAMEREFSFLQSLGYEFAGVTENFIESIGPTLEGRYTNAAVNRSVRVAYLPDSKTPGSRSVASTDVALIVPAPVDEDDYTTLHEMGVCDTELTAFEDRMAGLRQHVHDAALALKSGFGEVLAGRAWESDHLDWGGLK
jgi:hypothetical protein